MHCLIDFANLRSHHRFVQFCHVLDFNRCLDANAHKLLIMNYPLDTTEVQEPAMALPSYNHFSAGQQTLCVSKTCNANLQDSQ